MAWSLDKVEKEISFPQIAISTSEPGLWLPLTREPKIAAFSISENLFIVVINILHIFVSKTEIHAMPSNAEKSSCSIP